MRVINIHFQYHSNPSIFMVLGLFLSSVLYPYCINDEIQWNFGGTNGKRGLYNQVKWGAFTADYTEWIGL